MASSTLADAMPSMLRQRLDSRNGKPAPSPSVDRPREREGGKENARSLPIQARPLPSASPSNCVREVERMRMRREAMREAVEEQRRTRADDDGTAEFQEMIAAFRSKLELNPAAQAHSSARALPPSKLQRIRVVVRKRPLLSNEREGADYDTVTCVGKGRIVIHEPKTRVDLQKGMESHTFDVDDVFSEAASTREVYDRTVGALVAAMFDGCSATCFTYGQTGSGKTYTMLGRAAAGADQDAIAPQRPLEGPDDLGLYHLAAKDCFEQLELLRREGVALYLGVSFFEVYCGAVHDLLGERKLCRVLEDAQGEVQVRDLEELLPDSLTHLLEITARANSMRCVGTTSMNEHSSRSHAVLQLTLRLAESGDPYGRFSLVDLAGSERAADSAGSERNTRNEGAEINKSLVLFYFFFFFFFFFSELFKSYNEGAEINNSHFSFFFE
ncbi:P-loop containing nucleoside triphosphate hydrolase protein [Pavlovales sp. CCMP2436]|nr:P-loop containing nucleoside triphosphate hydrolase protein [Pavlovales sp. CCMP2436]